MKVDNYRVSSLMSFLITVMVFPWLITLGCVKGGWAWGPAVVFSLLSAWIITWSYITAFIEGIFDRACERKARSGEDHE